MKNKVFLLSILLLFLVLFFFIGLNVGSVKISFLEIINCLLNKEKNSEIKMILFNIRIPRTISEIIIGGLLAISGVILQSILKNPLADPFITGISSGAAFGASLGIILGLNNIILPAFVTAFLTIYFVYKISLINGRLVVGSLLLSGVMCGSFLSSLTMLFSSVFNRDLIKVVFWLMGDLSGLNPEHINLVLIFSAISFLLAMFFAYDLNIISTGEEEAKTTGVNVEFVKTYYFVLSSVIVAICVSISGVIGFAGLIIPHIMRYFIGSDVRILIPASFIGGGIFLLISDTLARSLFLPAEIPVGIITGLIGAPLFIFLINKGKNI